MARASEPLSKYKTLNKNRNALNHDWKQAKIKTLNKQYEDGNIVSLLCEV